MIFSSLNKLTDKDSLTRTGGFLSRFQAGSRSLAQDSTAGVADVDGVPSLEAIRSLESTLQDGY
jgi:hypothetical protein